MEKHPLFDEVMMLDIHWDDSDCVSWLQVGVPNSIFEVWAGSPGHYLGQNIVWIPS